MLERAFDALKPSAQPFRGAEEVGSARVLGQGGPATVELRGWMLPKGTQRYAT